MPFFLNLNYLIATIRMSREMGAPFVSDFQDGIGNLAFLAKSVVEGFLTGLHRSPFHGFSVEFSEHRPYNAGEDTRHVDWRLYARTDRLFTKKYSEETNMRCHLLIDTSSSMFFPSAEETQGGFNKLRFAVGAAASLSYLLYKQRDAISLNTFSNTVDFMSDCKSGAYHWHYVMERLSYWYDAARRPSAGQTTDLTAALHLLAEKMPKRSMVVLFSDMFDKSEADDRVDGDLPATSLAGNPVVASPALTAAFQHLRHRQHEVLLFHVQSRDKELRLQYDNRPYRFIDMETGEEVRLNPHDIREAYEERRTIRQTELRRLCERYAVDYIPAVIEDGFMPILQAYLASRHVKR